VHHSEKSVDCHVSKRHGLKLAAGKKTVEFKVLSKSNDIKELSTSTLKYEFKLHNCNR